MALPERTLEALTEGHKHMRFNEDGELTSAGGVGVDLYVLHSLVSWIKLELKTGMKMTRNGSTLKKANEMLGTNYRRKQQALDHLEGLLSLLKTEKMCEMCEVNPPRTSESKWCDSCRDDFKESED